MDIFNGIKSLKQIVQQDESRKPIMDVLPELAKWTLNNRGATYYFYLLGLQKKGHDPEAYIVDREYKKIHDLLDPEYYRPLLEDKVLFDRYIKSFDIPSPEIIGIIENQHILFIEADEPVPLESLLKRKMKAFCKQVTSWGGKNIYKLETDKGILKINNEVSTIADLKEQLGDRKYILQQEIQQHKILNELNPSCVNSVRIYTLFNGAKPRYFKSFLRMGVGKSIVDNVSSNNLAIGIKSNHFLAKRAYRRSNPPVWVTHHPDTGIRFSDVKIPYLAEGIELCCDTHQYFSDFLIIAWDVAITPHGPILLEGNPAPSITFIQVLYGGLKEEFLKAANK